ncbi:MAG: four helix bundle protein [Nostocales cyanobacterium]|nr:MAG: four helix bundle protein [Nostocales cyanobacterium]TAF20251.1 MAG: four helix bundle protein [Nostocales cyanobacterium]
MGNGRFQELRVYQLSEKLADDIWKIVHEWESLPQNTIGKQMIRSADSIGANIAEGVGRGSYPENRRFIRIARGSLYETQHWLRRAYSRNLLTDEQVNKLKVTINDLAPQLNAYLKSIGKISKQE